MRLRTALNNYKRDRSDPDRYAGERRTTEGAFSGHGDRLVHVDADGYLRDFSAPLSELYGIDRSQLGIRTGTETYWFADLDTIRQHYYRETNLVETEYDVGEFTVHQYDLTLGRAHVTHVELRGAVPSQAHLVAFMTLAPEGRETRVGRLIHEDGGPDGSKAVEVFHHHEHDYVTASTGLDEVHGQVPERFDELLGEEPVSFPRDVAARRYEDTHLSGDILVTAPLEQTGRAARTSLVTQLSDHDAISREEALADLRHCVSTHETSDDLRAAARERTSVTVPEESPRPSVVRTDLRVLDLLLAPTGAHVSAPDFDPFFVNSGGYGYCWFGEDATVAKNLLAVDDSVGLGVADRLADKAAFYCAGQLEDGTWPHRVWASDGDLAPGWANARVENDDTSGEFQAHQSAQVTAFLARFLRTRGDDIDDVLAGEIRKTLADAVDAMDGSLDQNGLPELCQNVWEDTMGQFAHTAACYIEAYVAVARAPVGPAVEAAATDSAHRVYEALDELWGDDAGTFAQRLDGNGIPDRRLDASTFALVDAFRAYASLESVTLSETDLDRLSSHVGALLNGLYRNPPGNPVGGLVRFEGDRWRTMDQADEKIWPLATAMGAAAAATLGELLEGYGRSGEAFLKRGSDLYNLLREEGPLTSDVGYLPAQVFDDGTLDGATPLGAAHALRLRATTVLGEQNALPTAPAPTGPEERLRWTTGEKYGVSTVADHGSQDPSRVWFTLTEGALTEARFPRIDLMNLRTLDFLVRCRDEQYVVRTHKENRRRSATDTVDRRVEPAADDALLFRHVITEQSDGHGHAWSLTVEYAADPDHDAVVADVTFEARDGKTYDVFAVADTALSTTGETERGLRLSGSTGHHLVARDAEAYTQSATPPLLVDEDGEGYSVALALAAEGRFDWATVGVAGDRHLQTLFSEEELPAGRDSVESDHVVLVGRIGSGAETDTRIALGFAGKADTAAALGEAEGALAAGYESIRDGYRDSWQCFLADKPLPDSVAGDPDLAAQYRSALMTLLAVEDKTFDGASVASPSVPWGEVVTASKAQGVGYNFVWSRDLYQVFTVFDAVDGLDRAIDHLEFVYEHQQQPDGFVPQNTYVNGETRWVGEQMDNISFPQVMAYHLWERGVDFEDVAYDFGNLRRSADYVARNGPATSQERWEEEAGYSPSTIAAEIAGLVCAGKVAMDTGRDADALSWFALADQWTNVVESWTATETGTEKHDRTPYYVRVTREGEPESGVKRTLANGGPTLDERDIVDAGFLELVRLGIKPWDDAVVRNSVAEVDKTIRVDLDGKPAFYRYNGDGYGERERGDQGGPWSVEHNGKGRLWPLLTGERGEYELLTEGEAASDDPQDLLDAMAAFANSGRMLAEQVWDRQYTTDYDWEPGEGTGAATPLAWAMAQFVRLAHGIDAGEPVETPEFVRQRYLEREVHEHDRGPALSVDTRFQGERIVFNGKTTGALVAVKTPVDSALVEPEDGTFEVGLEMEYGENTCIVAAASGTDLERAGTTVSRFTL
ncbi:MULTISPECIES: glycoside hydrolase family 15 protein [Haloarcula]|uniref:glycoside hydrolase family 15 protein n=1 Tax=Haloarcula TaxID=2237 RepID=UPI0023EC3144|nr:glycoside hydrolase family 15 protein [Halomicroarcula sp. XH51]